MVKKVSSHTADDSSGAKGKPLKSKRLKLKRLHRNVSQERDALNDLAPDQLPPASSGNAARQARSRLNITFPVKWRDIEPEKKPGPQDEQRAAEGKSGSE